MLRIPPARWLGLVLWLCAAGALAAQEPAPRVEADTLERLDLPRDVAAALIDFFNRPTTLHFSGATRIPAERTISGDVAVLGGPLVLGGRIDGRLVVINGDVELQPGAQVSGDLTVAGGVLSGVDGARVGGEIKVYTERLRYRRDGGRLAQRPVWEVWRRRGPPPARERAGGRRDFLFATGQSYNRVEGLPITFGPVIETASANPLRVRALGVYRTESGATLDDLGYYLRAEQFFGGTRSVRLGGTLHSLVDPIEDWQLSDLENGLATFLLHRDYRDHYEREGGSAFARLEPRGTPFSLGVEGRWEDHRSVGAGDPWTLFGNRSWRPQPLVAEGRLRSVALQTGLDTRNDRDQPSFGWYVQGRVERAYDTELRLPQRYANGGSLVDPPIGGFPPLPTERFGNFTTGLLDVRRYNRVGPDARLNFRVLAAGSLDGTALPPQRQHALGGEGSLPGYALFSRDCGARRSRVYRETGIDQGAEDPRTPYFPSYGCDAVALFQAEYRGDLDFRFHWSGRPWDDEDDADAEDYSASDLGWSASPDWAVFLDAGRGWAFERDRLLGRRNEDFVLDLGVGLVLDGIGIYAAVPLRGEGGVNFFVRLGARF